MVRHVGRKLKFKSPTCTFEIIQGTTRREETRPVGHHADGNEGDGQKRPAVYRNDQAHGEVQPQVDGVRARRQNRCVSGGTWFLLGMGASAKLSLISKNLKNESFD